MDETGIYTVQKPGKILVQLDRDRSDLQQAGKGEKT
jgi:hypothetical protein